MGWWRSWRQARHKWLKAERADVNSALAVTAARRQLKHAAVLRAHERRGGEAALAQVHGPAKRGDDEEGKGKGTEPRLLWGEKPAD